MASIGEGIAWPAIEFSSDGDFVHIRLQPEEKGDVAAIRYVSDVSAAIPAHGFERRVDEFIEQVRARLATFSGWNQEIEELVRELLQERADPDLTRECRLQAYAGIDPGEAPEGWLEEAARLSTTTGDTAIDEVMAVLPTLGNGLRTAKERIEAIRGSATKVDLSWVDTVDADVIGLTTKTELPWERGERLARNLRQRTGASSDGMRTSEMCERLNVKLPLPMSGSFPLSGAFRNGGLNKNVPVDVPWRLKESQRFYLARVIGSALLLPSQDHLLPVSNATTAVQKAERAFARELLCPWSTLREFTEVHGLDDEAIAEAAHHFEVSELLILSTLVNKGRVERERLEGYEP